VAAVAKVAVVTDRGKRAAEEFQRVARAEMLRS
jgi:hypothetical protein